MPYSSILGVMYLSSLPPPIKASHFSCFCPQSTHVLPLPTLKPPVGLFIFLASAVTLGYVLMTTNLELWTANEGKHEKFVLLGLGYTTQRPMF